MKKLCSSILAFLLCLSLLAAGVPAFASEDELKITVSADTHFQCFSDLGDFPTNPSEQNDIDGMLNREIYYYASMQGQMNFESSAIIKSMLADFAAGDDDFLLIAGDLTCGKKQSHLELSEMLRATENESGKEIFVICGNHDCGVGDNQVGIDEFKSIYADFGYSQALSRHTSSGSYTAALSHGYRLIAIDSCIYGEDGGEINDSVFEWIGEQAAAAREDGVKLIGMMHHSLLPHFAVDSAMSGYKKLAESFSEWGIKLVFTGHVHANDISAAATGAGNIYDVQTGSLITSPNAYRHVSLSDSGIAITSAYVEQIDASDLTDGYSAVQLKALTEDFSAYSRGFFEAGMCRWLNRNLGSARKIGQKLGLDADSEIYKELDRLLIVVGKSLTLPIYNSDASSGELDSLEEIAQSAGCVLSESKYERVYQLVASLMGGFYCGDEDAEAKQSDISLLFDCVKAAFSHAVAGMICEGKTSALLKHFNLEPKKSKLISETAAAVFEQTAVNRFVEALLNPLLNGFSKDYSAPADIDVRLEAYGEAGNSENTVPLSLLEKIFEFLMAFICALKQLR